MYIHTVYFLSFEVKQIRQKISSYCCNVPACNCCVCACAHSYVRCLAGGVKKLATVIAFLENIGLAGSSCCSRSARAGAQVLKVAAGPEIVTLATVLLVAVQQR